MKWSSDRLVIFEKEFLKLPHLLILVKQTKKTIESITSQKSGSPDFRYIANSILNKGKSVLPLLFNGSGLLISLLQKLNLFCYAGLTLVLLTRKMDWYVLEEKSAFKMLRISFSSKLGCGCYIVSTGKTSSNKIWTFICSMKILSSKIALNLYKSAIHPCMENWFVSGLLLLAATLIF